MFDLRTEAEMRLHSEKVAKELALKKQREEGVEKEVALPTSLTATDDPQPAVDT